MRRRQVYQAQFGLGAYPPEQDPYREMVKAKIDPANGSYVIDYPEKDSVDLKTAAADAPPSVEVAPSGESGSLHSPAAIPKRGPGRPVGWRKPR